MKKILLIVTVMIGICISFSLQAQSSLGLRVGLGKSNQYWEYTKSDYGERWPSRFKEKQEGFELFLISEIPLSDYFSLRAEIGYMEKGFYSDILNWDIIVAGGTFKNNTVEIRNISFNAAIKGGISLFKKIKLYLIGGWKADHLVEVRDWYFTVDDEVHDDYHDFIFDDYKGIIISGVVGGGIEWRSIFLEFQSNLPLTSSTVDNPICVKDYYYGVSIGLKIFNFPGKKDDS